VLPVLEEELGPGIAPALARTADLVRDDADLLDALAAAADPGTADLPVSALTSLAPALRRRVIRRWLVRKGVVGPGYGHVAEVERLVSDWHGQRGVDVPGVRVRRAGDCLIAESHRPPRLPPPT
jgi:tRNA(Ile)-lysidine synthase